jgi:hypothetical protein
MKAHGPSKQNKKCLAGALKLLSKKKSSVSRRRLTINLSHVVSVELM